MGLSKSALPALGRDTLGVQVHCLRHEMRDDFVATLRRIRSMGFTSIELCSFAGCSGNPWGDFGDLAEWAPERVRVALEDAGLDCIATHFMHKELLPERLNAAADWARRVGSPAIVLAALPLTTASTLPSWRAGFRSLNDIGERLAEHGLGFAYHTQNDIWGRVDDVLLADEMFRLVDPALCLVELDPSGSLVYGNDWTSVVRANPGRYLAMHLRDGARPPGHVPYLPALPLGDGDTDWHDAIRASLDAGVPRYLLEMEVGPELDAFTALQSSLEFLERSSWL